MDEGILADILDLIRRPISSELLSHVSDQASIVIPCRQPSTRSSAPANSKYGTLPTLSSFIGFLVKRSSIRTGTLLGALVFLHRLQQSLSTIAKGMPCTPHRIFLATLIVTSKALHDTSPKNKHWAKYAAYFTLSEINLMEKQLLSLMAICPSLPPSVLSKPAVTKPAAIALMTATNDADIPTYVAMYSKLSLPSMTDSSTSLSSTDSDTSVSTIEDHDIATLNYYSKTHEPPKAHCRNRNNIYEQVTVNDDANSFASQHK
ncbi:hypothetical protein HPULCUR_001358 [Helicostylum pulchrum]|uniref:Cyclin N-terminal domain-containing protein n=1 Tax=Helicostylum pulchrum TaxID=562976 RepID=A0ABP9XNI0_9FUNG